MSEVRRSNQMRTSQFEKKAENIIKGKWGSLTGKERIVSMVNRVGTWLGVGGAEQRRTEMKVQALDRLILKEVKAHGGTSVLKGRVTARCEKSVREVANRVGNLQVLDAGKIGKLSWLLSDAEMISETPEEGTIGKAGKAAFFHTSKGEHEEGRNEDAYAVSGRAFSVADGTSSGKKMSGQVARVFAEASTRALNDLVESGAIKKMSGEEVKKHIEGALVEAGHAFNKGIMESLEEGKNIESYINEQCNGKVGSTTGIAVAQVSAGKKEVRLVGLAVGDVSGTRIDLTAGTVSTLYAVKERKGAIDSGGEFTTITNPDVFQGVGDYPGYASDKKGTVIDVNVAKGEMVVLASDALYDNLPGANIEEKNAALLAIVKSPKYDTPVKKESDRPLPTLKQLEREVDNKVVSKETALTRIRNYIDSEMPPIALESWNSERAFACLPGNTYEEKLIARAAIVSNPKYDSPQNDSNVVPSLKDVTAEKPSPPDSEEKKLQRFTNYLKHLGGSSSTFMIDQREAGITIPQAGKPDDATVLVFQA